MNKKVSPFLLAHSPSPSLFCVFLSQNIYENWEKSTPCHSLFALSVVANRLFCRTVQTNRFSHIAAFNMSTSRHIIQFGLIALLVGESWRKVSFYFAVQILCLCFWLQAQCVLARNLIWSKKYWMIKWNEREKKLHCSFVVTIGYRQWNDEWLYTFFMAMNTEI